MTSERIDWAKKFELGVQEIDLQHHFFVDLINRLVDELGSSDEAYQMRLIQELDAYAKFHFISEENLMFKERFSGLEEHNHKHFELIQNLNVKQMLFSTGTLSAEEIIDFLRSWFVQHTMKEDMKFADYLDSR